MMRFAVVPVVILGAALAGGALLAQGPRNIQPLALEVRAGFEPMFDGSSLAGWEGDTSFWRVEGGLLGGPPIPRGFASLVTAFDNKREPTRRTTAKSACSVRLAPWPPWHLMMATAQGIGPPRPKHFNFCQQAKTAARPPSTAISAHAPRCTSR